MDTVYKAGSLICTQISSVCRIAALLPHLLIKNATQQQPQPHPGITYYEGTVTHMRRRPVENSFA